MKKYLLGFLAIAFAVAMTAFTSPAKKHATTTHATTTYFFQFDGTFQGEADPANWDEVGGISGCSGSGASCRIELDAQYVDATSSPAVIDASTLPNQLLPVVSGSGSNQVPDPLSAVYTNISDKN